MLYILFGREHIGKKTVRDFICQKYGIIIIPKFTDDKHKDWVLYNYKDYISQPFKLPEQRQALYDLKSQKKSNGIKTYICDKHDYFLRKLPENYKGAAETYKYEITKIYNDDKYKAKYFIKRSDIETAISTESNDYLLVCTSGAIIDSIIRDIENSDKNVRDVLSIIHIEGDRKQSKTARWEYLPEFRSGSELDVPAVYLFESSHRFSGHILNIAFADENGNIHQDKFETNISRQWECITGMLPKLPKAFFVRPFRDASTDKLGENINDLVEEEIKFLIDKIKININGNTKYVGSLNGGQGGIEYIDINEMPRDSSISIFDHINKAIMTSHIIIIDLRDHRLNCYYEYGYAMGVINTMNNKGKSIFCLLGVEDNNNTINFDEEVKEIPEEMKEKMFGQLLHNMENNKAYDTMPFPHYKYICQKGVADNDDAKADIIFVTESNKDENFISSITKLMENIMIKNEVDINQLAKN